MCVMCYACDGSFVAPFMIFSNYWCLFCMGLCLQVDSDSSYWVTHVSKFFDGICQRKTSCCQSQHCETS